MARFMRFSLVLLLLGLLSGCEMKIGQIEWIENPQGEIIEESHTSHWD